MTYLEGNYWVTIHRALEDNLAVLRWLQREVGMGLRAESERTVLAYGQPVPAPSLLRLHDILL